LTTIIHELEHTFEFFLSWFYTEDHICPKEENLPAKLQGPNDTKPVVANWMEVELVRGRLSNGDDFTGRNQFLRVSETQLPPRLLC
jgi:hypothetical protein